MPCHSRSKLFWGGKADTAEGSVPPSTKVGMQTIQMCIEMTESIINKYDNNETVNLEPGSYI